MSKSDRETPGFQMLKLAQIDAELEGVNARQFASDCLAYGAALTECTQGAGAVKRKLLALCNIADKRGGADE